MAQKQLDITNLTSLSDLPPETHIGILYADASYTVEPQYLHLLERNQRFKAKATVQYHKKKFRKALEIKKIEEEEKAKLLESQILPPAKKIKKIPVKKSVNSSSDGNKIEDEEKTKNE